MSYNRRLSVIINLLANIYVPEVVIILVYKFDFNSTGDTYVTAKIRATGG